MICIKHVATLRHQRLPNLILGWWLRLPVLRYGSICRGCSEHEQHVTEQIVSHADESDPVTTDYIRTHHATSAATISANSRINEGS